MPNRTPKTENLTNAGKGRPALGLVRTELNLPQETRDRLDVVAAQLGCHRNQAADLLLRSAMGMPLVDRDIPRYAKGSIDIPPDRLSGKQICGLSQWIHIHDRWFKWSGTPSEFLEFRELADSGLFTGAELIAHADWKLEPWVEF